MTIIKSLVLLVFMLIPAVSYSQIDSLTIYASIDSMQSIITSLKTENDNITQDIDLILQRLNKAEADIITTKSFLSAYDAKTIKIESEIIQNANILSATAEELGGKIDTTQDSINEQSSILTTRSILGAILAGLVLIISLLLSILLHKKGSSKIEALKKQSEKLNEEIIGKLSIEIAEMQKISTSIGSLSVTGASTEKEQGLIKALADRITFMEMTLYKMDSGVRGYKQLKKTISQMKDNLSASGYELVDMLGKEYHDGMKVTANFIEDESLEEGKQIITGIIKPQINYQGRMIQAAQITVSQNI